MKRQIDEVAKDYSNFIANTLDLSQSCTDPSKFELLEFSTLRVNKNQYFNLVANLLVLFVYWWGLIAAISISMSLYSNILFSCIHCAIETHPMIPYTKWIAVLNRGQRKTKTSILVFNQPSSSQTSVGQQISLAIERVVSLGTNARWYVGAYGIETNFIIT